MKKSIGVLLLLLGISFGYSKESKKLYDVNIYPGGSFHIITVGKIKNVVFESGSANFEATLIDDRMIRVDVTKEAKNLENAIIKIVYGKNKAEKLSIDVKSRSSSSIVSCELNNGLIKPYYKTDTERSYWGHGKQLLDEMKSFIKSAAIIVLVVILALILIRRIIHFCFKLLI